MAANERQSMSKMNPQVDGYIRKTKEWQEELSKLRSIILACDLTEEVKWRVPCYTFQGSNVVFLGRFKEACVLSFVKGALLKDRKRILIQQTENSQSVRVLRFANVQQIVDLEPTLKDYILEAVSAEKAGLKITFKKTADFSVPEVFKNKLDENPDLKAAFTALTPGRQRGYLLHFSGAKQSKTRASRVERWRQHILNGKGIDDE